MVVILHPSGRFTDLPNLSPPLSPILYVTRASNGLCINLHAYSTFDGLIVACIANYASGVRLSFHPAI